MGFASGSLSFRRFAVMGNGPSAPDEALLQKLSDNALRPGELGIPEEVEYGWSGGRHVLDAQFSFEHNVFADAVHFALRVDTNKVPGELKKAWQLMEEEAAAANNPSGFISKSQKREVKDSIGRKMDDELRSGRFRRSKLSPVLWDLPGQMLYCPAGGSTFEKLAELFERSVGLALQPLTAGSLALQILEPIGKRRDYEDFRPTRFVHGPGGESEYPEYPWVAKGPEPKDFLGNEFLLWLWHEADHRGGVIATEAVRDVTIYIDRSLDLDCAYGQSGRDSLRGDGPSRMPEARDALRSGKLPRKAGLVLDANGQQFTLTLNAESLALSGAKLPEVEEAENPRVLFEERIGLLRDLGQTIDGLFTSFLKIRASSSWEGQVSGIRKWIMELQKKVAAA
ncbi:MAG TPA: hypothetical protein VN541_14725 [Tepidisphaeraceae bacterium]|nr:hypothetical protein [Tepidisphaeraceae bacterium]